MAPGEVLRSNPIADTVACGARAASGTAAAGPLSRVTKSRRLRCAILMLAFNRMSEHSPGGHFPEFHDRVIMSGKQLRNLRYARARIQTRPAAAI
jgi:hypothetical protein